MSESFCVSCIAPKPYAYPPEDDCWILCKPCWATPEPLRGESAFDYLMRQETLAFLKARTEAATVHVGGTEWHPEHWAEGLLDDAEPVQE